MATITAPLIQIVDDQNNIIGAAEKAIAQRDGLWHRIVCTYVFNAAGELFIQQRNVKTDVTPFLWDHSSAGHVDEGEKPLQAAKRELYEELGITEAELTPIATFKTSETLSQKKLNRFWYLYKTTSDGPFVLNPDEIKAGKFITFSSLHIDMSKHPEKYAQGFPHTMAAYLRTLSSPTPPNQFQ